MSDFRAKIQIRKGKREESIELQIRRQDDRIHRIGHPSPVVLPDCHSMQKGDHRHADHIQASYRFVTDLFHQRPGRHRYRRSLRAQSRAGRILYVLHLRAYHQ